MLVHMIADYGLGDKEAPVLRPFVLPYSPKLVAGVFSEVCIQHRA